MQRVGFNHLPNKEDDGVWANQDAWFHLGEFNKKTSDIYKLKKERNGVYFFVLEGEVEIQNQQLNKRGGFGVWDTNSIQFTAEKSAKILVMEIPMNI